MALTRIVMIEIESASKNEANRIAALIAEQSVMPKHFLLSAIEKFSIDDETTAGPWLEIRVTNTLLRMGN